MNTEKRARAVIATALRDAGFYVNDDGGLSDLCCELAPSAPCDCLEIVIVANRQCMACGAIARQYRGEQHPTGWLCERCGGR